MKWKLLPVETTPEMCAVIRNENCVYTSDDELYVALLKAAPQPPKLSDERIKELSDIHMNMYGFDDVAFARAIEREKGGA